jgi:CHASE3 domain sensor protein
VQCTGGSQETNEGRREGYMNRGVISLIIGVLVIIVLVLVIMRMT